MKIYFRGACSLVKFHLVFYSMVFGFLDCQLFLYFFGVCDLIFRFLLLFFSLLTFFFGLSSLVFLLIDNLREMRNEMEKSLFMMINYHRAVIKYAIFLLM